jgi:hypothetical protein
VLVDLARSLAEHPEDRVTLLAPLLLILALRGAPAQPAAPRRDGAVAIALGAALQLLGIHAGSWSIARLGLPVAALGLARWTGRPRSAVMALLFFAVPLPDTLALLLSPALEARVAGAAGALLSALGAPVQALGVSLAAATGRIDLDPADGGATLAVAFAALGWYEAVRRGEALGRAALRAALAPCLAIPVQTLVVAVTGGLLAAGLEDAAELWLRQGAWPALSLLGLAWVERRSRAAGGHRSRCG